SGRGLVIGISRPLSRVVTGATVIITTAIDLTGVVAMTTTAAATITTTTLAVTTGIPVMDVTKETGVISPTDLPILVLSNPSPRFIGPFEILDRFGEVSYRLALPPQLSHVHDVFHVSLLRGYKYHPLHVISYPLDQIRTDLSYEEEPDAILDRQDRVMRKKNIPFVKILWRNHPEREAT
nr:hypothetical protein [Tanacetum cinerariifolium]